MAILAVATETGGRLRSYAHAVADFDPVLDILADSCCFAYDFVPYDDRVRCWTPTT